jgi:hypothetical protein
MGMRSKMLFTDGFKITKDGLKSVISVRDGVQEYAGIELGIEPFEKTLTVYRSAETISAIKDTMLGLPITDGHIDLTDIPPHKVIGIVDSSDIVENNDELASSSIAIKNGIKLADNMLNLLNGKNQLSLGYFAETENSDLYDFEQVNIVPHHLAIVESGRCGDVCKFKDEREKMTKEEQAKLDEEEAKKQDLLKKEIEAKDAEDKKVAEDKEMKDAEDKEMKDAEDKKLADEKAEADKKEEDKKSSEMKDAKNFTDSIEFKDAVKIVAGQRVDIILKAKNFLDSKYDFTKDNVTIQRDALATQCNTKFSDEEVGVAFKMLKKLEDYSKFADSKELDKWNDLKDKEI